MTNFFKRLIDDYATTLLAIVLSFISTSAFASTSGEITAPGGGVVKYTNADEVKTLANGEVVLIYTNANEFVNKKQRCANGLGARPALGATCSPRGQAKEGGRVDMAK